MDNQGQENPEEINRLIMEHRAAISNEIAASQPIVSDFLSFFVLQEEYETNPGFLIKIPYLAQKYRGFRKVRGDGNCFYRSFLFSLLEQFIERKQEVRKSASSIGTVYQSVVKTIRESGSMMAAVGYDSIVYEDYLQMVATMLDNIDIVDAATLKQQFVDEAMSNGLVMYMRFMTAAYLKQNADMFFPFLEGYVDISDFCQREVEPMDRESEQMQIMALQQALGVAIFIEEINTVAGERCRLIRFPETMDEREFSVKLLYRPGHYDILYS